MSSNVEVVDEAEVLAQSASITEGAQRLGVTRQTIYNWLKKDEFQQRYLEACQRLAQANAALSLAASANAQDVLIEILNDEEQHASTRVKAADILLRRGDNALFAAAADIRKKLPNE